jgi:hypothetical protein
MTITLPDGTQICILCEYSTDGCHCPDRFGDTDEDFR